MSNEHSSPTPDKIEGFEILQCLDSDVPIYQARDQTNGTLVTLTRLPMVPVLAWGSFLRASEPLLSLVSRHVARIHGFVAVEDRWFVSEEFLSGVDLADHIRRRSPTDVELFDLFRQVTQALSLLHRLGWPHGRLTPAHIRCETKVDDRLRVVLAAPRLAAPIASFSKTDFADDWHKLALCIQLALDSIPVPDGAATPERTILAQLSTDLLHSAANPLSAREIINRFHGPAFLPGLGPPLFERPELLTPMREMFLRARSGKVAVISLEGAVGLGKTTLLHSFLQECRARGSVVLSAVCNDQPEQPHGAFSFIIDGLCTTLRVMAPHDLRRVLTPEIAILGRLFPSLAEVISPYQDGSDNADVEPLEQRSRALSALRRLFATLGTTLPVVIAFDDAHHLDAATAMLIEQLLDENCPPIFLIFAAEKMPEAKSIEMIDRFKSREWREGTFRAIEVLPLDEVESQRWISKWNGSHKKENSEAIDRIVQAARGEPLLLCEFVRCSHLSSDERFVSYDDAISFRLRSLSDLARRILEMLAIAHHPLCTGDLARAFPEDDVGFAIAEAHEQDFIRAEGRRSQDKLHFDHSEIRRVISNRISAAQRRDWHSKIVRVLDQAATSASVLAFHYEGAGELGKAADLYELAANRAADVYAFDLAARGYRRALELASELDEQKRTALWERMAEALWFSGQTIAAGDAWATLARRTTGRRSAHFEEKAADAYLRGGYVDAAVAGLRQVLEQAGVPFPESRTGALLRLGWRKTIQAFASGLPTFTPGKQIDADVVHRLDLSWSMIGGLGNLDPVLGAYYQQVHLELALSSGDPLRASRALAVEAAFVAAQGAQNTPTVLQLLDQARQLVEAHDAPAYWQGILAMTRGESGFFRGDFLVAREELARAEMIFSEQCVGIVWELLATQFYQLYSLFYLGRFRELRSKETRARRFARSRGDVHALSMLRSIRVSMALADDDANRAVEELAIADRKWAAPGFHLHNLIDIRLRCEIDLYLGQVESADARAQSELRPLLSSTLNQIQFVRIEATHLRARCALAVMRPDAKDHKRRKIVEKSIRDLLDESCAWARALATLLEAGLAARGRDKASASNKLELAGKQFEILGMSMHEAMARRRRSEIDVPSHSAVPLSVIDRFLMDHHGLRCPARVAAMLAPGF